MSTPVHSQKGKERKKSGPKETKCRRRQMARTVKRVRVKRGEKSETKVSKH